MRDIIFRPWGRMFIFVLLLSFLSACAILKPGIKEETHPQVLLTLHVNESNYYRPGEAVICTARIFNISPQPRFFQSLNVQSLSFWLGKENTEEIKRVEPVFSKKEVFSEWTQVEPYDYAERTFVFTKLTETTGVLTLQAIYEGIQKAREDAPPKNVQAISKRISFLVQGEPKFKRDRDGILLKEEAIRVVQEKVGKPISLISANLIIDEAGFLNWWVTYSITDEQGKEVKKAYLVNPYLGSIRRELPPYQPPAEKQPPRPFIPPQRFGDMKKSK